MKEAKCDWEKLISWQLQWRISEFSRTIDKIGLNGGLQYRMKYRGKEKKRDAYVSHLIWLLGPSAWPFRSFKLGADKPKLGLQSRRTKTAPRRTEPPSSSVVKRKLMENSSKNPDKIVKNRKWPGQQQSIKLEAQFTSPCSCVTLWIANWGHNQLESSNFAGMPWTERLKMKDPNWRSNTINWAP